MCCCGKPVINGQLGYRWQPDDSPRIRPVDPPSLEDNDVLLHDEPGRCGGIDSHCHHYRVIKRSSRFYLLVKHGGGEDVVHLSLYHQQITVLDSLDSNARYWLLNAVYHAHSEADRNAEQREAARWRRAAAEKRIKTRKSRGYSQVKVWIEPETA